MDLKQVRGLVRRLLLREDEKAPSPAGGVEKEPWQTPFATNATVEDILACFRLLLGRNPNREEWRGHQMHVGEELTRVVASYLNSLEFTQRELLTRDHVGEIMLTDLGDFHIFTGAGDSAVGRHVRENRYEPEVSAVFRRFVRPGMGVVDIGANIGFFTMLSAALVGRTGYVLAVEPNSANIRLLEASRQLNDFRQIVVCQVAAGRETGLLMLNTSFSNGTTAALPADAQAVLRANLVPCVRVESQVPRNQRIDLIKADVEGAEYNALLGCGELIRRHRPIILTEFSPSLMPGISGISGSGYLRFLLAQDYALNVIQPDSSLHTADEDAIMTEYQTRATDHLDLLALPRDSAFSSTLG